MNLKDTYNKIAKEWHKDHQDDDWWVAGTEKFVSLLKKDASILDVGCGGGTKSKFFIKKEMNVVGIDFSDELIKIAKQEVPEGTFHVMDIAEVDRLNATFDAIFMQAVLLHIPKKDALKRILQLSKKLKSGGLFYISVKEMRSGGVEEEVKTEDDYGYPYARFFSYFTLEELKAYFTNAGIETIHEDVYPSGKTRWIQVIGRKK